MRTKMRWLFFCLCCFCFLAFSGYAQDRKSLRQQRKALKMEQEMQKRERLVDMIENRQFSFIANEITSTGKAAISKIRLNGLYGIYIRPESFKCYLPIYGADSFNPRPSLLKTLDFLEREYTIESTDRKGGIRVEMSATDSRTITKYLFVLLVPASGRNAVLTVSTNFDSPVSFTGDIR